MLKQNHSKQLALGLTILFVISCNVSDQSSKNDANDLIEIIHQVKLGWENADGSYFLNNYHDIKDSRYIETGGQNVGLQDLIEHHVEPEGDFLDSLTLSFSNIETHFEGEMAWTLADVVVKATVKKTGRIIHNKGYETFIFKRYNGSWKVIHTHSSTRPVKGKG